jgi:hypothetical protein
MVRKKEEMPGPIRKEEDGQKKKNTHGIIKYRTRRTVAKIIRIRKRSKDC